VTRLIVPIIASSGLLIPKTSSRAITSASGTADTREVLTDVNLDVNEIKEITNRSEE
jgi:AMP phosphorylase